MSDSDDDEAPLLVDLGTQDNEEVAVSSEPAPRVQQQPPESCDLTELPPCPVTILSGFLGKSPTASTED